MAGRWTRREVLHQNVGPAALYTNRGGGYQPRRHTRDEPGWGCTVCGRQWPCEPARVQLAEEYGTRRHALAIYMAGHLAEAVRDLPHATPAELFEWFVAWTGP